MDKTSFEDFLDSLSDWIWEMDMDGIHTYSNAAIESILGYTKQEIIGKHVTFCWPKELATPEKIRTFNTELKDGIPWKNFRGRFCHKDGRDVIMESTGIPLLNPDGTLRGYRGVDRDITHILEMERELEDKNENYRQENEFKLMLIDILSHDIINPVNAIVGMSEFLISGPPDREAITTIHSAAQSLNNTIQSTLKLAHILGEEHLEKESIDIHDLYENCIKSVKTNDSANGLLVKNHADPSHRVSANPIIREVFLNFLENAIRHGNGESSVIMKTELCAGKIRCSLIDQNDPIPPELKEDIFHRGKSGNIAAGGRGLGLWIVKKIAEAHGSQPELITNQPRGNTFYIDLDSTE